MFGLFKKKPEPIKEEKKKRNSLFSTHIRFDDWDNSQEDMISRVIKRTSADFRRVDSSGKAIPSDSTFAMDNNGDGNVTSLKPVISPDQSLPFVQLQWFAEQTFLGYQIMAIVAQHWLVDKACTMPARDAMRHGYDITLNDGEDIDPATLQKIKVLDKKFNLTKQCVEFARFNRIFGIRIAVPVIDTNEKKFFEKPFNIDGVRPGSYRGMAQIDPYWITPELNTVDASDPSAPNFYEPTWWRINGVRYHRSHLVLIRNGVVADILKPTYLYGGISIPQKICERVYAAERTANEGPMLAMTKRTMVWHMPLEEAAANQADFQQKMQWFAQTRDNYGVKSVDTDDVVEQFDTSLADLDAVIMTQYQLVAAIAEVPATKLLGTSPKGFNATGEFETDSYHEFLQSVQTHDIQPLLDRHYLLLSKSENLGIEITVNWKPVDSPGAKEEAEINLIRAQADASLASTGAIDGQDIRDRLIMDKDSGYNGMSDIVPEAPDDENQDD